MDEREYDEDLQQFRTTPSERPTTLGFLRWLRLFGHLGEDLHAEPGGLLVSDLIGLEAALATRAATEE